MKPGDYYDLTPAETDALLQGTENQIVEQWRMFRMLGVILVNIHSKKPIKETDLMKLPGDRERQAVESEAKALSDFYALAAALGATVEIEEAPGVTLATTTP
ncbi:MAG: hypothetical protein EOO39_18860 [Cytophagaceae bacterium]|nr:MAG: hypothetical protein EOO39_18860 [Cytophagaceae bacterium]